MKNLLFLFLTIFMMSCSDKSTNINFEKIALIYNGVGVSPTEDNYLGNGYCWDSIAKSAGYKTIFITEKDSQTVTQYFSKDAIWVQPGGDATEVVKYMPKTLVKNIIQFVSKGGGYVGSCAGAFLAGTKFSYRDTTGILYTFDGWGFIPDTVFVDPNLQDTSVYGKYNTYLSTKWQNRGDLDIYWWFGAVLSTKNLPLNRTNIISTYTIGNQQRILTINTFYNKGPVYITGAHPEADISWYREFINPPSHKINIVPTHEAAKDMLIWAFENNAYQ
ncbi:MAG: BPL-N domain-containing protein [Sediminibacterium sp.]|nr:BPL-N domain-containing protein [Sediminibacterium sp.]